MSRLVKNPIPFNEKTEVSISGNCILVNGPLGKLQRYYPLEELEISVDKENRTVLISKKRNSKFSRSILGTIASHTINMIKHVNEKFEKKLIIEGVGYKAEKSNQEIILSLGFSHKINLTIPEGIEINIEKNVMSISGIDKEIVSSYASKIKSFRKPNPYKGSGIRYFDEIIIKKVGKKNV